MTLWFVGVLDIFNGNINEVVIFKLRLLQMFPSFVYPEIKPTRLQKVFETKILHGDINNR